MHHSLVMNAAAQSKLGMQFEGKVDYQAADLLLDSGTGLSFVSHPFCRKGWCVLGQTVGFFPNKHARWQFCEWLVQSVCQNSGSSVLDDACCSSAG